MQKLNVKKIVIGKQFEDSENYRNLLKLVKKNNINLNIVEAGQRINIENNLYFDVLWPSSQNEITENSLNNNSLMCKLNYTNFSMLFTGDIEEIAEKQILNKYKKDVSKLKADILKVAHHGSKTSTTKEFLRLVKPQIALIGVGENNNFGHPSLEVLDNLKMNNCTVYRTDECGEIIVVNDKKQLKLKKCISN